MLPTFYDLDAAIKAADERAITVVYKIRDRFTLTCTSGRCEPVAVKVDGDWIRKA